jgi:pimeloyl-ACP methyl ester carboxylesterase
VGQLAWIAEKFHDWADPKSIISPDRLLTNVMLYWLTATASSSARLYAEPARHQPITRTPTGVAVFAGDIAAPVRRLAELDHNIVHWSEFDQGGHFAALEQPNLFTADVRAFFQLLDQQSQ